MQKITPHLWYDKEALEAAEFYAQVFPNSKINSKTVIHNTPSGDCDIITFEIMGYEFMSISAGPLFKFNPSISFFVYCETVEEINSLFSKLSEGGQILMPLDKYPFSERYAFISDKFGVSWQLILGESQQKIIPSLLFVGEQLMNSESAVNLYTSIFKNSSIKNMEKYQSGEISPEGSVKHALFTLEGQDFVAMSGAGQHNFAFNEAVSLIVHCKNQEEIDHYWNSLSADPKAEQCGWLKDKFGVSWQIVPENMNDFMKGDPEKVARVTEAFLKMKKFNIAELESAYAG